MPKIRLKRQNVRQLKRQVGKRSVRRKARRSVYRAAQQAGGRSVRLEAIEYGESTIQQKTITPVSESLSDPSLRSSIEPVSEPPKSMGVSEEPIFNLSEMPLRKSAYGHSSGYQFKQNKIIRPQLLEQGSFHCYNFNYKSSKTRLNEARLPIFKSKKKR